jgi:hypothetical protein
VLEGGEKKAGVAMAKEAWLNRQVAKAEEGDEERSKHHPRSS